MGDRFCEPILRYLRIRKIAKYITPNARVLDVGCGEEASTLTALSAKIASGVGIDIRAKERTTGNITILQSSFDGAPLPFTDNEFDAVLLVAVLEHLNHRVEILKEIKRVLKPGGTLVMTVPTWAAKPILEFLAFKVKIVSEEGVREHKTYFWKQELIEAFLAAGFKREHIKAHYFELGVNLSAVVSKER